MVEHGSPRQEFRDAPKVGMRWIRASGRDDKGFAAWHNLAEADRSAMARPPADAVAELIIISERFIFWESRIFFRSPIEAKVEVSGLDCNPNR
jgi:hypothetical protein